MPAGAAGKAPLTLIKCEEISGYFSRQVLPRARESARIRGFITGYLDLRGRQGRRPSEGERAMSMLLFIIGGIAVMVGAATVAFGIPINEFSFGNTLIVPAPPSAPAA